MSNKSQMYDILAENESRQHVEELLQAIGSFRLRKTTKAQHELFDLADKIREAYDG